MDIKEICLLIAQLKKENETNSPEEKDFNLKWIEILKESIDKSVRDAMKSFGYPVTFKSLFDYDFGANHMWVSDKESGKRLILVEF
jgi:hypothetical protein